MKHNIPPIQKFMTTSPLFIASGEPVTAAQKVMKDHDIRHLPVVDNGKLSGIISDRDIAIVESFKDVNPADVKVGDAMHTHVYQVTPDAPLDAVVKEMAVHKYGSAVVVDNKKVVGVFTTVDALNALSDLLHTRL